MIDLLQWFIEIRERFKKNFMSTYAYSNRIFKSLIILGSNNKTYIR